jgi:uncharacterized DUF497 family protein
MYNNIDGFEWDAKKELTNIAKHGVSFREAAQVFADPNRIIIYDRTHSTAEIRWLCIGKTSHGIVTIRFTLRRDKIRIIGAGYWRKQRKYYETTHLHRRSPRDQ